MSITAKLGQVVPDVARHRDGDLALDGTHTDANLPTHSSYPSEAEALQEGDADAPLLEFEFVADYKRNEKPLREPRRNTGITVDVPIGGI